MAFLLFRDKLETRVKEGEEQRCLLLEWLKPYLIPHC